MKKIIHNTVVTFILLFSINELKAQCSANFSYTLGANGTASFVSTSVGTATSTQYSWNFGDGAGYTSFGNGTAVHTYSTNQVFAVYLSIIDSISFNPACYSTYSDTLLINNAQCSGNLAFTYYVGLNGNVYFNDNSTGVSSNSTYTFSFGDGTSSSGAYSSLHTYTAAGIYTVSITAVDQFSICSYATTQTVNVTMNICPLVPSYSYTIGSNGSVSFVSTTTGTTASTIYYWNFGDGNSATGSSASNNYFNSGNYTATLFVSDSVQFGCSDTVNHSINITGCFANVSFSMYKDSTQLPNIIWDAYTNYPSGAVSATWSWGDGTSTAGMLFPSHTYSAAGMYNICVTVSVTCGATATACNNTSIYRATEQSSSPITINVMATPTGIKHNVLQEHGALVFPNPNNGEFEIKLNDSNEQVTIIVMNVFGQEVYHSFDSGNSNGTTRKLNLSELPAGTYFIKAKSSNSLFNTKVIISK